MKNLLTFILSLFMTALSQTVIADNTTMARWRTYDTYFQKAANEYLGGNSNILKAQCLVESGGDIDAEYNGAVGLCQFISSTWKYQSKKHHLKGMNRTNAGHSIKMAALYLKDLQQIWRAKRSEADIVSLALASYNSGTWHILAAQKHCKKHTGGTCMTYSEIISHLPYVVQKKNARITIAYVEKITTLARM